MNFRTLQGSNHRAVTGPLSLVISMVSGRIVGA
jgi:hypothetical protein